MTFIIDDNISALRIDLYECEKAPADILKPFIPKNYIESAWVPQTLGEQIWCGFLFKSKEERIDWEASLPDQISKWLDRKLISNIKGSGWYIRDLNGFIKK